MASRPQKAIENAETAVKLAAGKGQPKQAYAIQDRLDNYRKGRPCTE